VYKDGVAAHPWIQLGVNDVYDPLVALDDAGGGIWLDAFIRLPTYAESIGVTIQGDGWQIETLTVYNTASHYRTAEKRLYDGLNPIPSVWGYHYDGGATNDPEHSVNAGYDEYQHLTPPYAEYRPGFIRTTS
jgi:hypothetical protein